jgi:hypothetical protein
MTSRISFRPVFFLIAFLSVLLLLGGCGGDDSPDVLALEIDGKTVELKLDKMDIFLVEKEHEAENAESFEILGPEVVICGQFPLKMHVGYGEKYDVLKGQPISITKGNTDLREPKRSSVVLPGTGQMLIEGGTLTVEKISAGEDARTPLRGTIQMRLQTTAGERTVKGTFKVKATTWG